jgi:acyl-CoA thioesterase-1
MAKVQPLALVRPARESNLPSSSVKFWMLANLKKWAIHTGLIVAIAAGPASLPAARDSSHVKTILVLGDSLSDGFRLNRSEAYPALLAGKLRAAGLDYDVINASQTGGTSEEGLRRLPPLLKRRIDIFILELGINDAFLGREIETIRDNLQKIIDRVRQSSPNVRVIIAGMEVPNRVADDYVTAFSRLYEDLAHKNGTTLVPWLLAGVTGDSTRTLPDGVHPNQAGQKVLADNVWQILEPVAREVGGKSAK